MAHISIMSHIWMSHVTHINHVTHMNESSNTYQSICHTYEWVMSHISIYMSHIGMSCRGDDPRPWPPWRWSSTKFYFHHFRGVFFKAYFTHTSTYAHFRLPLFMDSWNMQEHLDSNIFWSGDGQSVGVSAIFRFTRMQTCHCFLFHLIIAFLRRIFSANHKAGNFESREVTRSLWKPPIPLLHLKKERERKRKRERDNAKEKKKERKRERERVLRRERDKEIERERERERKRKRKRETERTCWTWLIHMCDITHSYVWHDAFICLTWHIRICDMTHLYMWHGAFIFATWLNHMCDMTHSYMWYIHVRVCIYIHVHTFTSRVHMHACIYLYIHLYTHTLTFSLTCTRTHSVRTVLTGKLSEHVYAPDLGPKSPS